MFPVLGPAAYVDSFGAPRTTVSWHHGDDIFAPADAPVLVDRLVTSALNIKWDR